MKKGWSRKAKGAVIGGGSGAVIGALINKNNRLVGGALGGALGAGIGYVIGNEIPSSIVRWYGKDRIEKFLKELYRSVKKIDPRALVTYVNFPTTEYLDLSFLDFDCFMKQGCRVFSVETLEQQPAPAHLIVGILRVRNHQHAKRLVGCIVALGFPQRLGLLERLGVERRNG